MIVPNSKLRSDAKHPRVAQELRMRIVTGEFSPGDRLPLREQLQQELGASQATVQTALNTLLQEGFLRTVLGQGTFVTQRPPFLTDVGLVFPLVQDAFAKHRLFGAVATEAAKALASRPGTLRTYYGIAEPMGSEYERLLTDATHHRVAGLIWAGLNYPMHASPLWKDTALPPRVALQRSSNPYFDGPSIYPDMNSFMRIAMERLASRGRRKVAILTCDPTPLAVTTAQRLAEKVGMQCLAQNVIPLGAEWSTVCRRIVPLLLAQGPQTRPDALIIADDNLVSDATAALLTTRQRAPEDLSVVHLAHLPAPPQVHVPAEMLAFDASQLIHGCLELIDLQRRGQTPEPLTLIQPQWIETASTVTAGSLSV
jgi:GntR family transcriptional regulator